MDEDWNDPEVAFGLVVAAVIAVALLIVAIAG